MEVQENRAKLPPIESYTLTLTPREMAAFLNVSLGPDNITGVGTRMAVIEIRTAIRDKIGHLDWGKYKDETL
jgi:hypothetical protein